VSAPSERLVTADVTTRADVTIERIIPSGFWLCATVRDGFRQSRQYDECTRYDAVSMFVAEMNGTAAATDLYRTDPDLFHAIEETIR
jgi:hypothetical protein